MKINVRKSLCWFVIFGILLNVVCIFNVGLKSSFAETSDRYSATYGGGIQTYAYTEISSETVNYTNRVPVPVNLANAVPFYTQDGSLSNACGAVAGSIVVGYYDKYYEDLIPDYKAYLSNGNYKPNDRVYIPQVMKELYTLMRTNVDDVGVSKSDCINGLKAYVQGKNRNLSYTDVKNVNKVDENALLNAINAKKPVLLFCDKLDVYTFNYSDNVETITCTNKVSAGHVAVAYGLYTIKYYNGANLFRTDKYIMISTGLSRSVEYLKLDATDWCDGAYAVAVN